MGLRLTEIREKLNNLGPIRWGQLNPFKKLHYPDPDFISKEQELAEDFYQQFLERQRKDVS